MEADELIAAAEAALQKPHPVAAHRELLVVMLANFVSMKAEVERLQALHPED